MAVSPNRDPRDFSLALADEAQAAVSKAEKGTLALQNKLATTVSDLAGVQSALDNQTAVEVDKTAEVATAKAAEASAFSELARYKEEHVSCRAVS